MAIVVRVHDALSLQTVCFSESVDHAQLMRLYEFHNARRDYAAGDTVTTFTQDADLSPLSKEQLDDVRGRYGALHSSIEFFMLRRSGWVCLAPEARPAMNYWLTGRHSRDGQGAEVAVVDRLADLSGMFAPIELKALETKEGFRTVLDTRDAV